MGLASCGGGATGPISFDAIDETNVVGRSFADVAVQTREGQTSFSPVGQAAVTVRVLSTTQVEVRINSLPPEVLTLNSGTGDFESANGDLVLSIFEEDDGGTRPLHMLTFILFRTDAFGSYVDTFLDGNRTPSRNMPTSGTAVYTGIVESIDGQLNIGLGSITLNADFGNSQVGGTMTGVLPLNQGASFTIVPTTINGKNFNSTLSGGGVAISESYLDGDFYGPGAEQAGGIFRIQSSNGNATGYFAAGN